MLSTEVVLVLVLMQSVMRPMPGWCAQVGIILSCWQYKWLRDMLPERTYLWPSPPPHPSLIFSRVYT
ncbi:hypothetical protein P3L10_010009 [Capsicum annuum]